MKPVPLCPCERPIVIKGDTLCQTCKRGYEFVVARHTREQIFGNAKDKKQPER
jgi:hypothetical protein